MRHIKKLLRHYAGLTPPNESVRVAAQQALERICNIHIPVQDISYTNSTLRVDVSASARSTILVHKEELLDTLRDDLGIAIRDIR